MAHTLELARKLSESEDFQHVCEGKNISAGVSVGLCLMPSTFEEEMSALVVHWATTWSGKVYRMQR